MSKEMCCPICGQYIDVDEIYQQGYDDGFASVKDLGKLYSEIRAEAIEDFAKWLEEHDYLNRTELDYDYEENSFETIIGLSAEEVVNEYKEAENE